MFSPVVAQSLDSFREIESIKKDTFRSIHGMCTDPDSDNYAVILSARRWWLEYRSWTRELEFYFYSHWKVPVELLRFANELFVDRDDLNEVQVVWDAHIRRYYLKKMACSVTDGDQMPIVRLFREYPSKEPNGIWGVCKRPNNLDNPYDYFGVKLYMKLGPALEEISSSDVFC